MNVTPIEWVRNPDGSKGYTWNPVTGCLGPKGDGVRCDYCYANRLANGRMRRLYLSGQFILLAGKLFDPFAPRLWPERLEQPIRAKIGPSRIFVVDMGDMFGDWVPRNTQGMILDIVDRCPQHIFMFLTKWPQNLAFWNPWPNNCCLGATATDDEMAWRALEALAGVEASVRYLSAEPLLGRIADQTIPFWLDWLIVGAQTGPGTVQPEANWVEELRERTRFTDTALFLKDNLHWPERIQEWPI